MAFPTELEDLLEEGRVVIRSLVKFAIGSGTYGFWNGVGTLPWDGVDYLQNGLISVEEPMFQTGTAASEFKVVMPESRDFGITPDILAQIDSEDYKGYPCTIYDAYFHPDTRELLHVEAMMYGYIDTVDHVFEDKQWQLVGNMITRSLDNHREGYRSASDADQQLIAPGDKFFEYAAVAKSEYFDIDL